MKRILYSGAICLFICGAEPASAQEAAPCDATMTYENHNQIDPKPLKLKSVEGTAKDDQGIEVWDVCVGLFADKDHTLVAATQTAKDGRFVFPQIPRGQYRLVAKRFGFCTANVPLHVGSQPLRRKQKLALHMRPTAVDTCSYGDLAVVRTPATRGNRAHTRDTGEAEDRRDVY